ncbi:MAG: hypothetical protein JW908_08335 [Anaerolineales bacterium]|nr:hypothetical protein [Anaerolineales bacterium]
MSKKEKKTESQKTEKAPSKKSSSEGSLPVLFDVSLSISKLVVLLIGVLTSAISIVSGANAFSAALRGSLAMLAVGLTLWLINWIMVKESLNDFLDKVKKLRDHNESEMSGASTFEKNV